MVRFAHSEDIAQAVAFLAAPELSAYVNGHTLSVGGGWFGDGSWESLRHGKQGALLEPEGVHELPECFDRLV